VMTEAGRKRTMLAGSPTTPKGPISKSGGGKGKVSYHRHGAARRVPRASMCCLLQDDRPAKKAASRAILPLLYSYWGGEFILMASARRRRRSTRPGIFKHDRGRTPSICRSAHRAFRCSWRVTEGGGSGPRSGRTCVRRKLSAGCRIIPRNTNPGCFRLVALKPVEGNRGVHQGVAAAQTHAASSQRKLGSPFPLRAPRKK